MDTTTKGNLLVLITAVVSGFSIFINSIGVKEFDSSLFTFLKNSLVAVLLLLVLIGLGKLKLLRGLTRRQWLSLATIGLIGGSIPFLLFFKGLQMTTGTTGGFIHKTLFLYAAAFAILFLRERPTKGFFIGALLLVFGNYLLIRPDFTFRPAHLMIAAAAVLWAAENTYAKHVSKEVPGTAIAFGRMFFGSLFILVFLSFTGKVSLVTTLTMTHMLWVGLTSLFLLLFVLTFYNGLACTKVTSATCILTLGTPITTILGWIYAGKQVSLSQATGMFLVVAGVLCVVGYGYVLSMISRRGAEAADGRP